MTVHARMPRRLGLPGAESSGTEWTARWVAVVAVVLLTAVNLLGITLTVQATVTIVVPVVLYLLLKVALLWVLGVAGGARGGPGQSGVHAPSDHRALPHEAGDGA